MSDPTSQLEPKRLVLFRLHKDPTILKPEFEPLSRRLHFLDDIKDSDNVEELKTKVNELCEFVSLLEMGDFYSKQIEKLTKYPAHAYTRKLGGPDPEYTAKVQKHHQEYREQLQTKYSYSQLSFFVINVGRLRRRNFLKRTDAT